MWVRMGVVVILSLSVVRPWIDISSILQARSRRDAATPLPASGFRRLLLFSLCLRSSSAALSFWSDPAVALS